MPWVMRGLAVAIVFVSACGLITRVLPRIWPIAENVASERLSFPLTYWNALGILAGLGVILTIGIAANPRERRWASAFAAACVPVVATTLFFTFSRGAIISTLVALVVYVLVARSGT